jgi:hypothetical protein
MVVNYLTTNDLPEGNIRNLVMACQEILAREWEAKVQHIFREANQVADFLAKKALSLGLGYTSFVDPPEDVNYLMYADARNFASLRLIKL